LCCRFIPAATQQFWVVAGQHSYTAAVRLREECIRESKPVPKWTCTFRCTVLRPGIDPKKVEVVSGRVQAANANVMAMSFSDTVSFFFSLLQRHNKDFPGKEPNRTALLLETYTKTGKVTSIDGEPVCISANDLLQWLMLCIGTGWAYALGQDGHIVFEGTG
jgi:hypothetical protein